MAKMSDFLVKYMSVAEMKNIALLYGGTSSERDISLLSGKNVGEALASRGYNVTYIDPKQNEDMDKLRNEKFDIAYIALHGKGGEDGAIQAELEKLGIPYTGSKVQASKNAMNKAVTKEIFKRGKVSSPKYFVVNKHQKTDLEKQIKITGDDVVVKAANEGSSIGLYFAKGKEEIEKAIEKAKDFDDTIIVEQRISGREFTCAVIEFGSEDKEHLGDKLTFDGNNAALPVIEIVPKNEFYDFASKYDEGGSEHICPAEIDDELAQKIQKLALKAHKSLECSGFSRTDILLSDEGQVYALETNTIPGMTSKSLVPDAARAVGISFEDLCELLINNELKKSAAPSPLDPNNRAAKYAIAREEAKKAKKKKIIIAAITIGICLLSIFGAWLFSFLNTSFEDSDEFKIREELSESSFNEPFYMLLIGTDTREGGTYSLEDGRSDSCILVRIDPINYIVTMISIPRDTKMTDDSGTYKFNAVYAASGVKGTIKAVKKMMGVDIAHYAEISFNGLTDMVDAVGGVEVDVPDEINDDQTQVYVPAGKQTLNGAQALSFSRSRKFGDGDFTRTADQRVLIDALIRKAYKMGVGEVPNLLRAAKNFVKTDLRLVDMIGLAMQFLNADKELTLYSAMVPSYTSGEGGVSYVITDKDALKRMMKMCENGENVLYVEINSGASVCSSRDATNLEAERQAYYQQHPDSPGKISNSE